MQRQSVLVLWIGWLIIVSVGCGDDEGSVRLPLSGMVLSADIPENLQGTVSLMPEGETKGPAANGIIQNGWYEFTTEDGPVAGQHRVLIDVEPPRGKMDTAAQQSRLEWKFEFHITIPSEPPYEYDFPLVRDSADE
ncbi:MAG TPA: hypothetical protein EYG03_28890 [Planctomycetes bacterium]|nr:hypothetical protein [Fuerstiella sp.]HIK95980.1 hypothetical protein [Planctomycetota bacterium]